MHTTSLPYRCKNALVGSLLTGGKAVLLKGVTPKTIMETVSNEKCTIVWLLVPWAQDILLALDRGEIKKEDYNLTSGD